jgi:hypothetical protein
MAKHLDISTEPLGEGFFMKAFSVNSLTGPQPLNLDFHGVRIQDGNAVLFGFQSIGPGQRMPFFVPTDLSRLIGAMLIELAAIARDRDVVLRSAGFIDLGSVPDLAQRFERHGTRQHFPLTFSGPLCQTMRLNHASGRLPSINTSRSR